MVLVQYGHLRIVNGFSPQLIVQTILGPELFEHTSRLHSVKYRVEFLWTGFATPFNHRRVCVGLVESLGDQEAGRCLRVLQQVTLEIRLGDHSYVPPFCEQIAQTHSVVGAEADIEPLCEPLRVRVEVGESIVVAMSRYLRLEEVLTSWKV